MTPAPRSPLPPSQIAILVASGVHFPGVATTSPSSAQVMDARHSARRLLQLLCAQRGDTVGDALPDSLMLALLRLISGASHDPATDCVT